MAKVLTISLGDAKVVADLCLDEAPATIAALEAAGPFDSVVFSANICSNEITWNTPCGDVTDLENVVFEEDPGNVVFYPPWGCICVFYGPTEPAGKCTKIATIREEDLPAFIEEASRVWFKQGGIVSTAIVEEV